MKTGLIGNCVVLDEKCAVWEYKCVAAVGMVRRISNFISDAFGKRSGQILYFCDLFTIDQAATLIDYHIVTNHFSLAKS
jgi:hypothetical protein